LLAGPAHALPADPDPWFGPDKGLHFGASAGLAIAGYTGAAFLWDDEPRRLAAGGALALSLGIAKELYDLGGRGDPSWRDLTWDVIGTATGLAIAWAVDWLFFRPAATPKAAQHPARPLGSVLCLIST
jgi:putative lipoprotein